MIANLLLCVHTEFKVQLCNQWHTTHTHICVGVVTALLGVPTSQVAMGRSHTCILTQHGVVYTFGSNMYGQCGRNFVPPKEDGRECYIYLCPLDNGNQPLTLRHVLFHPLTL